jgi:hypothetical protein
VRLQIASSTYHQDQQQQQQQPSLYIVGPGGMFYGDETYDQDQLDKINTILSYYSAIDNTNAGLSDTILLLTIQMQDCQTFHMKGCTMK